MQNRIDNIRSAMDEIRKSGKLPHWRMVYADSLLTRAQEYVAVDRPPEAERILDKLDRWLSTHTPKADEEQRSEALPIVFWDKDMLLRIVGQIRKTLASKGPLVPSTERDAINRRLKFVEQWIDESKFLDAHDELLSLRSSLIARLRRSYRARVAAVTAYRSGNYSQPAGSLVGLYNSQHTLEETFHIVGERDPIWIEDFLEIYNDLFRIVERLVPQEKK
ncbi:hypothetical protein [Fibrobacter sp.]|uniref:hypothetical protein n=1 Tax=Fibrobacter sp. TaxID=35828 RepID=UPI00388F880A